MISRAPARSRAADDHLDRQDRDRERHHVRGGAGLEQVRRSESRDRPHDRREEPHDPHDARRPPSRAATCSTPIAASDTSTPTSAAYAIHEAIIAYLPFLLWRGEQGAQAFEVIGGELLVFHELRDELLW